MEPKIKHIDGSIAIIEHKNKEYKLKIKHSASHGYYVEFFKKRINIAEH